MTNDGLHNLIKEIKHWIENSETYLNHSDAKKPFQSGKYTCGQWYGAACLVEIHKKIEKYLFETKYWENIKEEK